MVTLFAWKVRGAVKPDVGSVRPTGIVEEASEVHGTEVVVEVVAAAVAVLQYGAPEGPPSPYPK
jgi:hypothetical protein